MTTGNTTLLGLALPVEGELDGTWGDVVNDSITSLLDSAVAGTTTLSVDADVTLTTTALAANQARQAIIRWTASNGATTRNITAPAQSKPYIVINAGTGSIVLRGAGPTTGITVAAGERCLAAWSGSDFVKVSTSTASGVTSVGGTGTVNGITLTGTVTSTGNLTLGGTLSGVSLATQVTGTLPVGNGGTGATTLTANNVILGNGTSAVQFVAPGTSGNVLTSNGTTWTSATPSGGSLTGTTDSASPFKTALGSGAATSTTGIRNTAMGYQALFTNSTGTQATALGYNALYNSTGGSSTAVGNFAGYNEGTGNSNVAVGESAGYYVTTGVYNVSLGVGASGNATGSNNVAVGRNSLGALSTASTNNGVAVGSLALNNVQGDNNTAVGYQAGRSVSTGTNNTIIGYNAAFSGTNNLSTGSNNTLIGNAAEASANSVSNEITLGNSSISTLRCQVTSITSLSDARDKTDVAPLNDGLKFVNALSPVRFKWNTRDGAKVGVPDVGFIAQHLKQVQEDTGIAVPNLVYESNPDRMEAAYGTLIPVLVKAIQELSAEVAALKAKA
jgi:hypothetical protein